MNHDEYDFVVLGGGSAGYAAARTAVGEGLKVAVIEGGEELGGLCILRGCMPSKALIECANRAATIRRAPEFGLDAGGPPRVDGAAIIARKRHLIREFADYRAGQLTDGRFELIRGLAAFSGPDALNVSLRDGGEKRVRFRSALVATGSVIAKPAIEGLAEAGYLTSDEVLELEDIPASAVVLGGGPVALELAAYLLGLGARVSLVQRSGHVLSTGDEDLARALEEALRSRGMEIFTGTRLIRAVTDAKGVRFVEFEHQGTGRRVSGEAIVQALGRRPNSARLSLDAGGVESRRGAVTVDAAQRNPGNPRVFAAGDVCGPYEIVHIAIQQGEIAARNAARVLRGEPAAAMERFDDSLRLFAVFTDPEMAAVGMDEKQAAREGVDVVVAKHPFDDHGKSLVMGETHGFVKLLADRASGRLVGGAVVGPHASDLIHEIVVALAAGMTPARLAAVPHYHPTLSEIWTYPAEDLAEALAAG